MKPILERLINVKRNETCPEGFVQFDRSKAYSKL